MQTLRELMDVWTDTQNPETVDVARRFLEYHNVLDLTILEGVGLVAMDVEAGAKSVWGFVDNGNTGLIPSPWLALSEGNRGHFRDLLTVILTACGIIPVDEVVEGCVYTDGEHDSEWLLLAPPDSTRDGVVWDSTMLGKENERVTITITRNSSESPNCCQIGNSCSGKSTLHPQDKEGE